MVKMKMSEDTFAADAYKYIVEYARLAYEKDLRRQDSIIQQASHMQTAFSFMTAALFMVASLLVDNCKRLSSWFYLIAFSAITFVLLFSLFAATMAQNRKRPAPQGAQRRRPDGAQRSGEKRQGAPRRRPVKKKKKSKNLIKK